MIFLSGIVLSDILPGTHPNSPLVGYHNVVRANNITGPSSTLSTNPERLLASTDTYSYWASSSLAEQAITIARAGAFDYVGIARHNFGTGGTSVRVEGHDGGDWVSLTTPVVPDNDDPLMLVFETEYYERYRVALLPGTLPPRAAVLYLGNVLALPSRIYVGHTPIPYSIEEDMTDGISESGDYLGRVYRNESRSGQIVQQNIDPAFYRLHMDPWVRSRDPFFFAWRPQKYPSEVGYVWRTGAAKPVNQRPNGMMQLTMNVVGVA